jgi:DNA-binding NtrC family response regulator
MGCWRVSETRPTAWMRVGEFAPYVRYRAYSDFELAYVLCNQRRRETSMSRTDHQRKIYLVDDEHIISSTLARILSLRGFDATGFTDPLIALQVARFEAPDLLISDVVMPELSGIELAKQVQFDCPQCRVILFSGQANLADLLEIPGEKARRYELLSKPVHPEVLLRAIEKIFELDVRPEIERIPI